MKNAFVLISILASAVTSFATHAYRSETCTSTTHQLFYKGNYPTGGSTGLTKLDSTEESELWEKSEEEGSGEANEFEVKNAKVLKSQLVKAKCGVKGDVDFDEEISSTQKVIKFSSLTKEEEERSGITAGTYMIFNCEETFSIPVHCK